MSLNPVLFHLHLTTVDIFTIYWKLQLRLLIACECVYVVCLAAWRGTEWELSGAKDVKSPQHVMQTIG